MKVHSSHDIEFEIQRRQIGRPQKLYMREHIGTAGVDDLTLDIAQSLNRVAFFVEHPNGDMVVFNVKHLIDVAATILISGHPAEPQKAKPHGALVTRMVDGRKLKVCGDCGMPRTDDDWGKPCKGAPHD